MANHIESMFVGFQSAGILVCFETAKRPKESTLAPQPTATRNSFRKAKHTFHKSFAQTGSRVSFFSAGDFSRSIMKEKNVSRQVCWSRPSRARPHLTRLRISLLKFMRQSHVTSMAARLALNSISRLSRQVPTNYASSRNISIDVDVADRSMKTSNFP